MEFLLAEPSVIELELPVRAFRTQIIRVVNTDYRPISVSVVSEDDWVDVSLSDFTLKSGQSRNLRAILSVPDDEKEKRIGKIVFKPDRGKPAEITLSVYKPGKAPKQKSKKEVRK